LVGRHDKTYLSWNLTREKILMEKCYVKVLKRFQPARPAIENVLYEKELREIFSYGKSFLNSICNISNRVFKYKTVIQNRLFGQVFAKNKSANKTVNDF
jgi:hypothetical protein